MKKLAVLIAVALVSASAFAAYLSNSYIVINGTWYNGTGGGDNPAFQGSLGDFTSAFTLGGEMKDFGENTAADNPLLLNYCFDIADGENWKSVEIGYGGWKPDGGYNLFKQANAGPADFSGLDYGEHTIAIYFSKVTDGGDTIYNNPDGGVNFQASFNYQAVPEPATMSLLGLGALAMVIRRKLRK